MIRALFTWPYRSKRLRTDSSLALKSRLPTKIFFTQFSCQFESGAHAGRAHQRGRYRYTRPDSRKLIKRAMNIPHPLDWGQRKLAQKAWSKTQRPRLKLGSLVSINRATSYSPTQLPVQYHRG